MGYSAAAWEWAMRMQDVILRAISGEIHWFKAADILGMTPRNLRRWKERYEQWGYNGLVDKRRCPSKRRVSMAELERVLRLYRERYRGFNGQHFYEIVRREHGVTLSYSYMKQALQQAGLLPKRKARGRHRRRREPRACFGELLHLDGSPHGWLALVPDWRGTLITVVDDATKALLFAQLWPQETIRAVMSALAHVLRTEGLPMALYTDRAGWAFHTPKARGPVDKTRVTQVGRALRQLGIEHIPAYSPQARGRSERMNRTLQGRLVNELRVAGAATLEAANAYLRDVYLPRHNETFRCAPRDPANAFVPVGSVDLDTILCQEEERVIAPDNTVLVAGHVLQIERQPGRRTCAGLRVLARQHLDGTITIIRPPDVRLGHFRADGRPLRATRVPTRSDRKIDRPGCPRNDDRRGDQAGPSPIRAPFAGATA